MTGKREKANERGEDMEETSKASRRCPRRNVYITPGIWGDCRKRALEEGTTASEIIRRALRKYLYEQ